MITQGRHSAIVRSVQFGTTKKGIEQVVVEFQIVSDGPDSGASITWFGFFSDKAVSRTLDALKMTGWDGNDLTQVEALAEAGKLSTTVQIVVEHETYNEKTTAKVKWINRIGGKVKLEKPMEARCLRALADRIKNGGPSPAPSSGGDSYGDHGTDDGLPFASSSLNSEPCPKRKLRGWP